MNRAGRSIVIVRWHPRTNDASAKTLVVSLRVVVHSKIAKQMPKMSFAEDDEMIETLGPDGLHESLRMRIAVRAAGGGGHAMHTLGFKQCRPRRCEKWIAVVNEVRGVTQEAVGWVEQMAGDLLYPGCVGIDAKTGDMHCSRPKLDDEEDHHPNAADDAKRLDSKEIASVEGGPVTRQEVPPRSLSPPLWRRFKPRLGQDSRHCGPPDFDLQPTQGIPDLRVSSAEIFLGDADDQIANVGGFARSAWRSALARAIVRSGGKLAERCQDRGRADDLAAHFTLGRRERLTFDREPASLVGREPNARTAGWVGQNLAKHADLLVEVLDPLRHPIVDRVRKHRDDELDRQRKHRGAETMPGPPLMFQSVPTPPIVREFQANGYPDTTGNLSKSATIITCHPSWRDINPRGIVSDEQTAHDDRPIDNVVAPTDVLMAVATFKGSTASSWREGARRRPKRIG